jgi:alkylhydroperoxidase family enzyme
MRVAIPGAEDFERPEDREAYAAVVDRFGGPEAVSPYFGALLNAPPFAAGLARMGTLVRLAGEREGTYSHVEREFVDQVLAADWQTNVVQKTHIPDALAVGVRMEAIDALRAGREEDLTDEERALADYIRKVVSGGVDDKARDAIEQRMGRRGMVEYTIFIALLQLIMRMYQAFGLPDPAQEEIDALLAGIRSGEIELPDFRKRLR